MHQERITTPNQHRNSWRLAGHEWVHAIHESPIVVHSHKTTLRVQTNPATLVHTDGEDLESSNVGVFVRLLSEYEWRAGWRTAGSANALLQSSPVRGSFQFISRQLMRHLGMRGLWTEHVLRHDGRRVRESIELNQLSCRGEIPKAWARWNWVEEPTSAILNLLWELICCATSIKIMDWFH